jgi:hypothetical protein
MTAWVGADQTRLVELIGTSGEVKARNHVYFGESAGAAGDGPQSFMVEHPIGRVGTAHFHNVDQYQVFYPSPGATYKNSPITSPIFHYTDAYTVYGPYAGGAEQPLRSLTLRALHSQVTAYVPQDRDQLPKARAPRRHVTIALGPAADLPAGQMSTRALIEPDTDGLAAFVVEAGPGAVVDVPRDLSGGGQFSCVLDGAVVEDGRSIGVDAVGWELHPAAETFTAGADGMRVLVMRFPDPPSTEQSTQDS